jgi:DNA-directed RNA polymerase alpha subunit
VSELRTERVTLEITHDEPRSAATWDYLSALRLSHPGESVKVIPTSTTQLTPEELAVIQEAVEMRVTARGRSWSYLFGNHLDVLNALLKRYREQPQNQLALSVTALGLSARGLNVLQSAGVQTIGELTQMTETRILECRNGSELTLAEIKARLADKGLSLAGADKTAATDELKIASKTIDVLLLPLSDVELSVRTGHCLERMGIQTLGDLAQTTEAELVKSKNFGETSLVEIKEMLAANGLALANTEKTADELERQILSQPISELALSVRARKVATKMDAHTIGDLIKNTAKEISLFKNAGVITLNEIREKLAERGLKLKGD